MMPEQATTAGAVEGGTPQPGSQPAATPAQPATQPVTQPAATQQPGQEGEEKPKVTEEQAKFATSIGVTLEAGQEVDSNTAKLLEQARSGKAASAASANALNQANQEKQTLLDQLNAYKPAAPTDATPVAAQPQPGQAQPPITATPAQPPVAPPAQPAPAVAPAPEPANTELDEKIAKIVNLNLSMALSNQFPDLKEDYESGKFMESVKERGVDITDPDAMLAYATERSNYVKLEKELEGYRKADPKRQPLNGDGTAAPVSMDKMTAEQARQIMLKVNRENGDKTSDEYKKAVEVSQQSVNL